MKCDEDGCNKEAKYWATGNGITPTHGVWCAEHILQFIKNRGESGQHMSRIIIPSAFKKDEEVAQTFSSTPADCYNFGVEDVEKAMKLIEEYAEKTKSKYFILKAGGNGLEAKPISEFAGEHLWSGLRMMPPDGGKL